MSDYRVNMCSIIKKIKVQSATAEKIVNTLFLITYESDSFTSGLPFCDYCLKLGTHEAKICASFRASFYNCVLTSFQSNIARLHVNVETCSKNCASFLLLCHQFKVKINKLFMVCRWPCSRISICFHTATLTVGLHACNV